MSMHTFLAEKNIM